MYRLLKIGQSEITDDSDTYVIAEIGHNHQGDFEKAKELFRVAKEAGANAVKLQKRDNKALFTEKMYNKSYENRNSYGATYGEHREFLEFDSDQYRDLKDYASGLGLDFFSTAFDIPSANFLAKLDLPAYKIASGDIRSIPLLEHVASLGKPILISTGGANMQDIRRAYNAIMPINKQLCIMHCTAGYPPEWDQLNLSVIETFRREFPDIVIGFSSHDSGIAMAIASHVLGARIVEKHFTLNRALKGTDHAFSLEPVGLKKMIRDLRRLKLALGDGEKVIFESEVGPCTKMGKSLVATRSLSCGHILSEGDITMKSPGGGLPPYELDRIVGLKLVKDIALDDVFSSDCFTGTLKE